MTKTHVLDIEGKKKHDITTVLFEEPIREDIILKIVESEKTKQPYRPRRYAGMDRSASGSVLHTRHDWKTDRGKGMSRYPKKKMWRRGTQFAWEGAIVPSVKGGRRAHPPKGIYHELKINKKEMKKALLSALSITSSEFHIKKKYSSLSNQKIDIKFPIIIEDKITQIKAKEFLQSMKKILGDLYTISIPKKSTRAGIGKLRGRRYKKNAGILFVLGNEEKLNIKGIESIKAKDLTTSDLASNGARLTLYTEKSIKDLEKQFGGKKE